MQILSSLATAIALGTGNVEAAVVFRFGLGPVARICSFPVFGKRADVARFPFSLFIVASFLGRSPLLTGLAMAARAIVVYFFRPSLVELLRPKPSHNACIAGQDRWWRELVTTPGSGVR